MRITYYQGIKSKKPSRYLTLQEVCEIIKTSPNVGLIKTIRLLKSKNDSRYKEEKLKLPIITPHVESLARKLSEDEFEQNFRSFTQIMYFDIDDVENVHEEKQRIIEQYKDFVSLVCISPSGAGISIFIRIENELTKENFNPIWNSIVQNQFSGEKIDMKANGIARTMFLSSDPDIYYNPNVKLLVNIEPIEKVGIDINSGFNLNNNINSHFSANNTITKEKYKLYSINDILPLINSHTKVDVDHHIVDLKKIEYVKLYIPKTIKKSRRHSTLYAMIHHLYYLNPNLEIDIIYSYLWYINNVYANPKLNNSDFRSHFNNVVKQIHESNIVYVNIKNRHVHFNKNCWYIKPKEKMILAKKLIGLFKRHENQSKIFEAIEILKSEGKKISNISIKGITGYDVKTIRKHRKSSKIDLDVEVSLIIDEFSKL